MAQQFGLTITEQEAQNYVNLWRSANPWATQFGDELERAARLAISRPGMSFEAGRVEYTFYPNLIEGTLVCTLPGGALIQYPKARLDTVLAQDGKSERTVITALKANWKPGPGDSDWPRVTLWRGLLAENVTQAICAFLLRDTTHRLLARDLMVVAHVHDEIVQEVADEEADEAKAALQHEMEANPSWATGLPLIAEPKIMVRYGK
jgi:hypothetical protein